MKIFAPIFLHRKTSVRISFLILYLLMVLAVEGSPSRESQEPVQSHAEQTPGEMIEVTGTLRLIGNEPFTRLALIDSQQTIYYLDSPSRNEIRNCIGNRIWVEGTLRRKKITLADGKHLEDKLILSPKQWKISTELHSVPRAP
ncbi:MAG: hypothetical protein KA771_05485 [Spirochaetales bacterium]|nr:hypothetical protein [Spirochaetales bacterium]